MALCQEISTERIILRMKATNAIAAGLLTAILVAGCGGSSDSATSKSAFIEEADAICAKVRKEAPAVKAKTLAASLVAKVQPEINQIEALEVPSGDEDQIEAFLEPARKFVAMVEAKGGKGTPAAGSQLATAEKLAQQYGLKTCWVL